ncbi:hypothetical protein GUJ93_ZPchr0007g4947 [Zizania palustris]|uniref:Uncharacterized protein n=1 Tax=Zizania palustris TaxID=103762 RepID=A0A8J5T3N3_ZIZPA|nr:hypothetical protein GUJ93_ZPchr0007g4947 [Zizania palustris]
MSLAAVLAQGLNSQKLGLNADLYISSQGIFDKYSVSVNNLRTSDMQNPTNKIEQQARSSELKEFEIGLYMTKLQLKQSQLAFRKLPSKIQGEKFKTQMQETRDAQILWTLIDFLVSAVIVISACFGYGTYIYSYQRIADVTPACNVTSRGSKSWWMPNSLSNFSSRLLFIRCHVYNPFETLKK